MTYPYGQSSDPSGQQGQPGMFPQYDPQQHSSYAEPSHDGGGWQQQGYAQPGATQTPYGSPNPYAQPAGGYGAYGNYGAGPGPHPYLTMTYGPLNPPRPQVGMLQAVRLMFRNFTCFYGRASRSEYWWVFLFHTLVALLWTVGFGMTAAMAPASDGDPGTASMLWTIPFALYWLMAVVPTLALHVRRLHDTGQSGWLYLLSVIPYVGGFILIILCAQPGKPSGIRYDDPTGAQPEVS